MNVSDRAGMEPNGAGLYSEVGSNLKHVGQSLSASSLLPG